jgi:hypothetical protein
MTRRNATPTDLVCPCDGVSAREFDGEWIILDLNGGNYFGLDELGGTVWNQLCAGTSPAEIAERFAPQYHVGQATLLQDILSLLDELLERDLVRVRE